MDTSHAFPSFAVNDLQRAEAFYRDTLGMDARIEGEDDMQMLTITLGTGSRILVYPKPDHQAASYTMLNIPVPDVETAVGELTSRGVTMNRYEGFDQDAKGIARGQGGPTIAWFNDPDGNTIAVLSEDPNA